MVILSVILCAFIVGCSHNDNPAVADCVHGIMGDAGVLAGFQTEPLSAGVEGLPEKGTQIRGEVGPAGGQRYGRLEASVTDGRMPFFLLFIC
jgi:hypothetical protein